MTTLTKVLGAVTASHVGLVRERREFVVEQQGPSSSAENFLAGALLAIGRARDAAAHLSRAVTLAPRDEHVQFNLARAFEAEGDSGGAIDQLRKALSLNRDFADAHQELGVLLFERNQLADAIAHLTDATRLAPRSATAHAALGGALAQAGRLNEAVMHFEQALTLP